MKSPVDNGLQSVVGSAPFTLERWTLTEGAVPQDRHVHAEWQICEYLDAPGHYQHRGSRHAIAVGGLALIPPGDVHCPVDDEIRLGAHYRVWYFDDRTVTTLREEADAASRTSRRLPTVARDPGLSALLGRIAAAPPGAAETTRCVELVCARLAGLAPGAHARALARSVRDATLEASRDYLFDHPDRWVPLDELAVAVGLSTSRLSHAFQARYAISPSALSLRIRTDHARRAILAGSTVMDAALGAGFADQAHLTRCFRRFVGPTPKAYRRLAGLFKTTGD